MSSSKTDYTELRELMVREQLEGRGIVDQRVLDAMRTLPRHEFLPEELAAMAYADRALPLGPDQTISQPYIVAYMLEKLVLSGTERVLEIGTGSGYQTALLGMLAWEVFSLDISSELIKKAEQNLKDQLVQNVHLKCGDGFAGWPEEAPFDSIVVTAAPPHIPRELVKQLKDSGRMVLPLGTSDQLLIRLTKENQSLKCEELSEVRFVPMKSE